MESDVSSVVEGFFERYQVREYKKGQILIHAGDTPDGIFHLITGKVKQYDLTYRGDEVILNVFKPPAFFPASFAVSDHVNRYFFEAEEDVALHRVPIAEVRAFLIAKPEVTFDLLARVYRGTQGMLERMVHLMSSTSKSRVIYELIIECRRFGESSPQGTVITLTESDVAARAGLSRETVNREMAKLKNASLIKIEQKKIIIPKLDALELSLGQDT
jgi:CRP-like cAMP-binding protein